MRVFGFLGTVITLAIAMYLYSSQIKTFEPAAAAGNTEDTANIAGVKNDLISIANAERGFMATQGKLGTIDELISGNYITIRRERPPYSYNIEPTGNSFRVTATRMTKGSPSQMWIGDDMEVGSSD